MTFANKNREMKLEVKIAIITTSKIITYVTFIPIIIVAIIIVIISIKIKRKEFEKDGKGNETSNTAMICDNLTTVSISAIFSMIMIAIIAAIIRIVSFEKFTL